MLEAVIFDFDGVIVNSEPLHYQALQDVLGPIGLGFSWEDYASLYLGFDDRDAVRERFKRGGRELAEDRIAELVSAKAAAFRKTVAKRPIETYPGVLDLIRALSSRVPVALCSGSLPGDITPILDRLGLTAAFRVIVTAADVEASKPDPASYELTVRRLGQAAGNHVRPSCCVAIEDSPWGITSAHGAGLAVLAVANSYGPAALAEAECVVASLAEVQVTDLEKLAA